MQGQGQGSGFWGGVILLAIAAGMFWGTTVLASGGDGDWGTARALTWLMLGVVIPISIATTVVVATLKALFRMAVNAAREDK